MKNDIVKLKIIGALILMSLFIFLCLNSIDAAPAPWGIALKKETRECAGYWPGDEFTNYSLPEDWRDYYFDDELENGITVEDCMGTDYNETGYKRCCDQISYEYISDNIGKELTISYDDYDLGEEIKKEVAKSIWDRLLFYFIGFGLLFFIVLVILVLYFVKKKRK